MQPTNKVVASEQGFVSILTTVSKKNADFDTKLAFFSFCQNIKGLRFWKRSKVRFYRLFAVLFGRLFCAEKILLNDPLVKNRVIVQEYYCLSVCLHIIQGHFRQTSDLFGITGGGKRSMPFNQ